jgi:hypothetical protein
MIGNNTKHIVLVHLSQENNTKDKALYTLLNTIEKNDQLDIIVAEQDERTQVIEI